MQIIIVGCGKVGSTIAEQLSVEGHDIVIVDTDEEVVKALHIFHMIFLLSLPLFQAAKAV